MTFVTKPFLPPLEEYTSLLRKIWKNNILTNRGEFLQEFENKLSELTGVRNVICVANGTIALQVAIKMLELKGEVITTPFSFVATSSSILWENCTPAYADIDPETLNLDPLKVEETINSNTSAILATHVFSNPCDVKAFKRISQKHNLKLIYDGAHAFGINHEGHSIFSYGDISTISFHATKSLNTGEGGAIFTNNDETAKKIRLAINFGYENYKIIQLGINAKMNEFNAALGILNLKYYKNCFTSRKEKTLLYDSALNGNTNIRFPSFLENNYTYYPVIFSSPALKNKVKEKLESINIFPREYFSPSLDKVFINDNSYCPLSNEISEKILCLPIYPDLDNSLILKISDVINNIN